MLRMLVLLVAVAAPAALTATESRADPYRWCAVYSGRGGGASNCGFVTWDQCMATVSGIGGFCEPNQFYTGPDRAQQPPRKRSRDRTYDRPY